MEKQIVDNGKLWKGIFAIGIGLIMVAWPGLTTRTIVVFLGIALLVLGAILLIGWLRRKRAGAPVQVPLASTVTLLIGLCMTAMPQLFINILLVVFGILLVLAGLDQILTLILGRQAGVRLSVYFYIAPVLVLAIGLYLMFSPQTSAQTFILLFGITAIVYGVVALYDAYLLRNPKTNDDEEESI